MSTSDTQVSNLVINRLTKAQYDAATKNANELYLVEYQAPTASDLGCPTSADLAAKASLSGATFTGNVTTLGSFGTPVAVSASAIDLSLGTVFTKTATADITFTISNALSAKSNCFSLILTNGGAYTITWPGTVLWAGGEAPELTESGTDVVTFLTPDGGSTWYGVPSSLDAQ